MEPLSTASAFATIVGLVCNFRSERQSGQQDDYNEFLRWMDNVRHKELIEELNSNVSLAQGVKALLEDNHEQIMVKLKALESSMSAVASHINGLREISQALSPAHGLSDQAFSILKQLYDSGGSFFLELKILGGTSYQVMDASSNNVIEINEERFVEDDLNQLCDLGLLIPDHNRQGHRLFRLTRSAAKLAEANEL